MQLGMAQVTSSLTFSARNVAINKFACAYLQSHLHRLWARLTHRTHHLLDLKHTGTWFGFSSRMMYFPALDVTLVVLVNQHFMNTSPITEAAMGIITGASN